MMLVVVEATLSAMCGWQGPATPAVHRHGVAPQQMSTGHRIHQVRMSSKRKAKPAEAASEVVVDEAIQNILDDERCNVCLTHVNADFDSLAGACALAKLWSIERPGLPTHVVMPRGVNPLVSRFLAYHKHLLPIRGFKTIREQDVAAVGVVDTQSVDRLGAAGGWLAAAEHVCVVDHHAAPGDIEPDESIIEPVGSATTLPLTLPLTLPYPYP